MATCTNFLALAQWIGDLQRRMHRVAGQTVGCLKNSHGAVVLVTFRTLRDSTMFFRMAGRTLLLGMLAHLCLEAGSDLVMAQLAAFFQAGRIGNRDQGLVRIRMAFQTLHDRLGAAMGRIMTAAALGHDRRVIVAQRIIGMKNLMAVGTGHCLVEGAVIPQPSIM